MIGSRDRSDRSTFTSKESQGGEKRENSLYWAGKRMRRNKLNNIVWFIPYWRVYFPTDLALIPSLSFLSELQSKLNLWTPGLKDAICFCRFWTRWHDTETIGLQPKHLAGPHSFCIYEVLREVPSRTQTGHQAPSYDKGMGCMKRPIKR